MKSSVQSSVQERGESRGDTGKYQCPPFFSPRSHASAQQKWYGIYFVAQIGTQRMPGDFPEFQLKRRKPSKIRDPTADWPSMKGESQLFKYAWSPL